MNDLDQVCSHRALIITRVEEIMFWELCEQVINRHLRKFTQLRARRSDILSKAVGESSRYSRTTVRQRMSILCSHTQPGVHCVLAVCSIGRLEGSFGTLHIYRGQDVPEDGRWKRDGF